ncbi:MAG TPA: GNAT family protein [Prolixibacteraceae bacterium]|nr:GNAT family protein [Prolixibacteraceae bacterium]
MNIVLKIWETRDVEALLKYAGNPKITQFMSDGFAGVSTPEGAAKFIVFANSGSDKIYRAIQVDGQIVGGIGVMVQTDIYRKNAELGYWLAEPFWGKGITTKAIEMLVSEATEQLDITRIFARPFHTNKASHRVLEKAGFRLEAVLEKAVFKNGEYLDEWIYAIRI